MFYWIDNELDPALSDGVQDLRSWVQGAGKYNLLVHFFYCSFIPSFISLIKKYFLGCPQQTGRAWKGQMEPWPELLHHPLPRMTKPLGDRSINGGQTLRRQGPLYSGQIPKAKGDNHC
jgi:hypothetical protein